MSVRSRHTEALIAVLLVVITTAVYAQVLGHDFVSFDDPDHNTSNPYLRNGFTWEGLQWAFTSMRLHTWHPLTWMSHMLDCQLFGQRAWGHHLSSLLIHILSSVLLFRVLRQMTGGIGPSAFVAALFALHPLHVETVAWVSERLDLLCTLFWILGLGAYGRYAASPTVGRYLVVVLMYVLSLMSKQMVVTFPFVLLLLDYWPLGRVGNSVTHSPTRPLAWLLLEKLPLFLLSGIGVVMAFVVKIQFGAVQNLDLIPLANRLENAVVSYAAYLLQTLWPTNLAVFYPHPGDTLPAWQVACASTFLVIMTAGVLALCRRQPALLVGWFWYLGTLVPTIGLVQVGLQARADRYTYIPLIGVGIVVAWGIEALLRHFPARRTVLAAMGSVVVLAMAAVSWVQAGYWRNSEGLFRRAVDVTSENYWAHNNLGNTFSRQRRFAQAIEQYRAALRIKPNDAMIQANYVQAQNEWGVIAAERGSFDTATELFKAVLRIDPLDPKAHFNLGHVLAQQGKAEQAIGHYRTAAAAAAERNENKLAEQIKFRLRLYDQDPRLRKSTERETSPP